MAQKESPRELSKINVRFFYYLLIGSGLLLVVLALAEKPLDYTQLLIGFLNVVTGFLFLMAGKTSGSSSGNDK